MCTGARSARSRSPELQGLTAGMRIALANCLGLLERLLPASAEECRRDGVVLDERESRLEIIRIELHGALEFSAGVPRERRLAEHAGLLCQLSVRHTELVMRPGAARIFGDALLRQLERRLRIALRDERRRDEKSDERDPSHSSRFS